jgi:crotonobetainyl-CoA:carnitine CoA-transferase CaiB-like acyl-CoA transferase
LQKSNKKLIMLSMSGMGQTGPWEDFVAFGPTVQSLGGLTYLTSYSKNAPMGFGYAYADMISGVYGAILILAALEYREKTGQGQYIDLSEYEVACTTIGPALMDAFVNLNDIIPMGNDDVHLQTAPYGCYKCLGEDRWCAVAVFTEDEWQAFCGVLGNPAWTRENKFSSLPNRKKYRKELDLLISDWMAKQTTESAVESLQRAGVPAGVVQSAEDLANDPQLLANDFFTSLNHPVLGEIKSDSTPINFKNYLKTSWKASPLLGEANQYVFGELLGLTETTIRSYIRQGIIT